MLVHYFQIITKFLYVCQSISWHTYLLILGKYRDISSSGWDIFLKFFGDISGMLAHQFQIIMNFLYVCQSVSCHTSLQIFMDVTTWKRVGGYSGGCRQNVLPYIIQLIRFWLVCEKAGGCIPPSPPYDVHNNMYIVVYYCICPLITIDGFLKIYQYV